MVVTLKETTSKYYQKKKKKKFIVGVQIFFSISSIEQHFSTMTGSFTSLVSQVKQKAALTLKTPTYF